ADQEHTPAVQVPAPPLQLVPSWTAGNWQPSVASQMKSCVHSTPSTHTSGVPCWHTPVRHVSWPLQMVPSLHGVEAGSLVAVVGPVVAWATAVVQGLPSSQSVAKAQSKVNGSTLSDVRVRTPPTRSGSGTQPGDGQFGKSMPLARSRSPSKNHTPTGM